MEQTQSEKKTNILEKIKAFLLSSETVEQSNDAENVELQEVALESQTLKDGTIVQFDVWEKGASISIAPKEEGDQAVALPVGEYELEDGQILVIEEEGVIGDVREASTEEESTEEVEEMSEIEKLQAELSEMTKQRDELKSLLEQAEVELSKSIENESSENESNDDETVELSAETQETEDVTSTRQEEVAKPLYNLSRKTSKTTSRVYQILNRK